jgi:Uri superfamily endonuclease
VKAAIEALLNAQDKAVGRHVKSTSMVAWAVDSLLDAQQRLIIAQRRFDETVRVLETERWNQTNIETEMAEIGAAIVKLESE